MLTIIEIVLALILVFLFVYKPLHYWKELNIPHVKPWPFFGNMISFVFRLDTMHKWLQDLYSSDNSKVLGIYSFNLPILMIKDLNLIKQIGIKDFDYFVDHKEFISEDIDPLFGKNLFSLKGEKWRNMRSTLSPAFTSSKMKSMFILISDCAKQFTNHFITNTDPHKPLEIELKDSFTRFANDVIATTAFGIQCDSLKEKNNEFYLMGKDATNFSGWRAIKLFGYQICKPFMKFFKIQIFSSKVREFFRNIIKITLVTREQKHIVRPDMIHLLMEARKGKLNHEVTKDEDAGFATVDESDVGKDVRMAKQELSDDDITAQVLLFFIAGFDTISVALCHMGYELAQHQNIQERLQEEIDEALKENNGKITYELVMKMKYLDMILCETLRKWPPFIAVDRQCVNPYTINADDSGVGPIKIKKGDNIWFPIFAIHRDPQYYSDPDVFDPERFSDENKNNIDPMSYIPFGVGPRNCIGSRFALLEAKILFVNLLSKFDIVLTKKSQIPLRYKKGQFNLHSEKGFWVGFKKRENI